MTTQISAQIFTLMFKSPNCRKINGWIGRCVWCLVTSSVLEVQEK